MSLYNDIWALASFIENIAVFFISLITGIWGLSTTVYNIVIDFLSVFPSEWTIPLGIGFTIVVGLRVYYFVKDISIAGFKI